jgi:hypothetical protein
MTLKQKKNRGVEINVAVCQCERVCCMHGDEAMLPKSISNSYVNNSLNMNLRSFSGKFFSNSYVKRVLKFTNSLQNSISSLYLPTTLGLPKSMLVLNPSQKPYFGHCFASSHCPVEHKSISSAMCCIHVVAAATF